MNLWMLVWSYLKGKPLQTTLNILLLALGIAVIATLIVIGRQLREKVSLNTHGVDLVVGAKGSPLQIILCNIFHVDFPTGNIPLREADKLARHRLVKKAIPLALGDSYQNHRIVGTDTAYANLYGCQLKDGNWWRGDMEIVAGANAAAEIGLKIGDRFSSAHGLTTDGHDHEESPFLVVGIMQKTGQVTDNLLLTSVGSVWRVHDKKGGPSDSARGRSILVPGAPAHDSTLEVTSLLIRYRNPIAAIQLPRLINSQTSMQAASPAFETARLISVLGVGVDVLMGFGLVLVLISGLSIFIALYNSLKERRYDMAIMRSMGATRMKLFVAITLEGVVLALAGSFAGLLLGHSVTWLFTAFVDESQRTGFTAFTFYGEEWLLLLVSVGIGLLCAVLPAWQAYRTDIHNTLAGS